MVVLQHLPSVHLPNNMYRLPCCSPKHRASHPRAIVPQGQQGWGAGDSRLIPETPNKPKSLCRGDTPVLAMALKLPCTHFPLPIFLPCLSPPPWCRMFICARASAATCPPSLGKPRGQTQTSPLPAQQSPSFPQHHRHHCFLFPTPLALSACPQAEHRAGPKLVVSSWSPARPQHTGHCRWDCQSRCCGCSAKVSEGG